MKTGLIMVDIQLDYFPGGKWELVGMDAAAEKSAELLAAFREAECPIFHIQHVATDPNAPFFVAGTEGVEFHPVVQPKPNEKIIQKAYANSFMQTSLLDDLRDAQVERLVICGAMSQNCVDSTTRAAVDLGFTCVVAHDACATKDLEFGGQKIPAEQVQNSFMSALAFAFAKVVPTSEAIAYRDPSYVG